MNPVELHETDSLFDVAAPSDMHELVLNDSFRSLLGGIVMTGNVIANRAAGISIESSSIGIG